MVKSSIVFPNDKSLNPPSYSIIQTFMVKQKPANANLKKQKLGTVLLKILKYFSLLYNNSYTLMQVIHININVLFV